jgi:hypothetical protein
LVRKCEGKRPFEDLGTDGMIILKYILDKLGGRVLTGFFSFKIGTSGGLL